MMAIIAGLIGLVGKFGDYELQKILQKHLNDLLAVRQELAALDTAFANDTDNRDDLKYVDLKKQEILLEQALNAQIQLAQNK